MDTSNESDESTMKKIVWTDFDNFYDDYLDLINTMKTKAQDLVEEFKGYVAQIAVNRSGPLVPKTPKASRKQIESIPEDEVVGETTIKTTIETSKVNEIEDEVFPTRSKRAASIRASKTIKKQQSVNLNSKLRRPSTTEDIADSLQAIQSNGLKRPKVSHSDSGDDSKRPIKHCKIEHLESKCDTKPILETVPVSSSELCNIRVEEPAACSTELDNGSFIKSNKELSLPVKASESSIDHEVTLTEQSMYEDAIGKSIPMNSTMNPNTTVTIDRKMLNVTVVLEKVNETRIIHKSSMSTRSTSSMTDTMKLISEPTQSESFTPNNAQSEQIPSYATNMVNNQIDELITDDESSPDRDKVRVINKKIEKLPVKKRKRVRENIIEDSDEDVVLGSPIQTILKPPNAIKRQHDIKYKSNAIFSPYSKDSVKKRVEAFEKARLISPSPVVELTERMTRTKTRALATNIDEVKTPHFATKLARKSLAKAIKISLSKQKRENEEEKENALIDSSGKSNKLPSKNEKLAVKQQQRTTPISKSRLQVPMSGSRIPRTPIGSQLLPSKPMTSSRLHNIASSMESLSSFKPISKSSSTDSLVDKRNKVINANDEDARKKKEEALKAQTEEKRRKREEKELKNKLAREAKKKSEEEKRAKLEREREEKARNALIMQEKLREEAEKKRLAQLQRAQEKEERRKQEEQLKIQRLQEQEETERMLAEQKRREQEAERRRMAEQRSQQLAEANAARLKLQYQAKLLQQQKQLAPTSYKIDSEPDDESDTESEPKHPIPHWAKSQIRKTQLEMQQYIPMECVLKFFGAKKCTPDLSELFVGIRKERLKRTSSAIWKTPPRFSMMEDVNEK